MLHISKFPKGLPNNCQTVTDSCIHTSGTEPRLKLDNEEEKFHIPSRCGIFPTCQFSVRLHAEHSA